MIPTDEAGGRAEHQSRQSLLQAASGVGGRSCTDAAHGRAASGVPLRRRAHAAGAAGYRGKQGGPASCENADAADGDGNGLSQAEYLQARLRLEYLQARVRPQDLSVSTAWPCAQPYPTIISTSMRSRTCWRLLIWLRFSHR